MRSHRFRIWFSWTLFAVAQATVGLTAHGRESAEARPGSVQDLAYGKVLFHFYQEDYFSALTQLMVAGARDELDYHEDEAELLLGGLYLSYGQHQRADELFSRLLEQSTEPETHDRAWFFLAKIWYQRGFFEKSQQALNRINDYLPADLEAERYLLQGRVLMDQGRFDEALVQLSEWRDPGEEWVGYARFNVGVSLVRLGRVEEGARILDEVGQLAFEGSDLSGLRDKANVALGYGWLQAQRPDQAKRSLQRVRLAGPFSNKALLGVGWSDAELNNYQSALLPWLELSKRSVLDPAVQESLLAVPYAFNQLGADKQAADSYLDAIETFNREIARLDDAILSVEQGDFVDEIVGDSSTDASGWYWQLDSLPDLIESHYLYELVATHRFQEGLKNYRDLQQLGANLRRWTDSLGAFDDILDTQQRAHEQRLPVIEGSLDRVDLNDMAARETAYASRLTVIERNKDVRALGTTREQALWSEFESMQPGLASLGDYPGAQELRDKHRLLQGLLSWNLHRDYVSRLWQAKKDLRSLGDSLRTAERAYQHIDAARSEWPGKFAGLSQRIAELAPTVRRLDVQVQQTLGRQTRDLQRLATQELRAQRERLSTYVVQARFALASVYDRTAALQLETGQ